MKEIKISPSRFILPTIVALAFYCCSSCSIFKAFNAEQANSYPDADSLATANHAHGTLESMTYKCSVDGPSHRRMFIYLPEGYTSHPNKRYPTVYLFHGARGNESSWITKGDIIHTADSLVRTGQIEPCILVFTNMNQYASDKEGYRSRFKKPFESFFDTDGAVESGFVHDVVNRVDSKYRTLTDKANRAICGLSIGALQSIFISANYPDLFGKVGMFSPMYKAYITHSNYSDFYKNLKKKQTVQFSEPPTVYNIYIGKSDIFYYHMEYYRQYLHSRDFHFEYTETPGGHDWDNWTEYIKMFLKSSFGL